jgi:hypothetical protein
MHSSTLLHRVWINRRSSLTISTVKLNAATSTRGVGLSEVPTVYGRKMCSCKLGSQQRCVPSTSSSIDSLLLGVGSRSAGILAGLGSGR